jgi:hypothetical protein
MGDTQRGIWFQKPTFPSLRRNYTEDAYTLLYSYFALKTAFLVNQQVKFTAEDVSEEKVVSGWYSALRNLTVVTLHFESTLV